LKFLDKASTNNFTFSYDTEGRQYFLERADPIFDERLIMDMVNPRLIKIGKRELEHAEPPIQEIPLPSYGEFHQLGEGEYIGES